MSWSGFLYRLSWEYFITFSKTLCRKRCADDSDYNPFADDVQHILAHLDKRAGTCVTLTPDIPGYLAKSARALMSLVPIRASYCLAHCFQ